MERDELERLIGGRLRLTFDEILNHPRLPEARRAYLGSFVHLYEGDPFLVRLLLEAGRFFVFHSVAVLEAARDPSRRETWFTAAALKQQLATFGFASGRQVDHLVARLREVGFLEQRRAPGDGHVRLLAATQKLRWFIFMRSPGIFQVDEVRSISDQRASTASLVRQAVKIRKLSMEAAPVAADRSAINCGASA